MKTILFGLLLLSFYTYAQRSEITLKNGSVILGKVKTINDSTVKVTTKDGSVWQYSKTDIKSIEKYDYTNTTGKIYSSVTFGYMPGNILGSSIQILNGYRFNNHWNVGIGIGKEKIENLNYVPLLLHGQYNLLKANTTPFISVIVGYDLALDNNEYNKGGFTTGAQIGINHYFSDHIGLTTSVGYRYGYFKNENQNWGWPNPTVTIREINRLEFRFGLVFK